MMSTIKIPVFLSCPSILNERQQVVYDCLTDALDQERLQPRALGRSDFPQSDPMTEVYYIARACYGAIILGFAQMDFPSGVIKPGTSSETPVARTVLPTPWNQIEAGMMIGLRKPLLVFAEQGVTGGIFDPGAFSGYIQKLTVDNFGPGEREGMRERVRQWSAQVRSLFRS
ncbi:MAG: hypothetical protein SFW09_08080 [Hyphomicrobiaceae bacterium]|nr:hypothetical protein [Hyphomicrobiaceae bacterium]